MAKYMAMDSTISLLSVCPCYETAAPSRNLLVSRGGFLISIYIEKQAVLSQAMMLSIDWQAEIACQIIISYKDKKKKPKMNYLKTH
ncbi:hypothetical protein [Planomicrobium soli]|uniref:hypothetical protein n=1 Tax=Planomicrobium soli TaxID=1176648 RepID=UPI0011B23DE0|nr:hypothetical protein [Planomicrobium soli]